MVFAARCYTVLTVLRGRHPTSSINSRNRRSLPPALFTHFPFVGEVLYIHYLAATKNCFTPLAQKALYKLGVWNAHNFVNVRRAQTQAASLEPTHCWKCIARSKFGIGHSITELQQISYQQGKHVGSNDAACICARCMVTKLAVCPIRKVRAFHTPRSMQVCIAVSTLAIELQLTGRFHAPV